MPQRITTIGSQHRTDSTIIGMAYKGNPPAAPAVTPNVLSPSGAARGRVYLFHGLDTTYAQFATSPFDTLVSGLLSDSWQVVEVGEMYDGASQSTSTQTDFTGDTGHGSRFRSEVIALHQTTTAWVNYHYGTPPGTNDAILGISWGGLMVELLGQDTTDFTFRGCVAHVPATNPSVMTEFSGDNVSGLQPTAAWGSCPGWISYGTSDTRVGYTDTQTLANTLHGINSAVQVVSYAQGHTTNSTNVSDMLTFMAAL